MEKQTTAIIALVSIVVAGLAVSAIITFSAPTAKVAEEAAYTQLEMKTTGNTNPGNVQADLTPRTYENGRVEVAFETNTHSGSMNLYDLKKITVLEYQGREYKSVSAPLLGGHHNSGVIIFELPEQPESFTITIIGVPSVEERIYTW